MAQNTIDHPITIDLNQFKIHMELKNRIELTLHFNSPSRKFYLSVIAFVVHEMKRLRKITSIPLEGHHDLLALLNETIGDSAGSSETETLLSRIYTKWHHALPNLEEAPLFVVLGRRKGYEEGTGKTYRLTETEKDIWANLFEYKGSHENVRLKFAVDKIGATLDDVVIVYDDSLNDEAWGKFIAGLKETGAESDLQILSLTQNPALPDKPSIVVLPFVNMTGDLKQEFLCDALTENITTMLAMMSGLFVIARNSAFEYKGKQVDVKRVAKNLGVRYVLEGSIQKSGERIRVTAQLIDATSGHHISSEKYDRDMKDFFPVLDDITRHICIALQIKLTDGEQARIFHKDTQNLEAWAAASQGFDVIQRFTKEDVARAKELAEKAVELDPNYGFAWSLLAWTYLDEALMGWCESPEKSFAKAVELNEKSLKINKDLFCGTAMLGSIYLWRDRDYDRAIETGRRAIELGPNQAPNYCGLAITLNLAGKFDDAITMGEQARRLHPYCPLWYLDTLATSYRMAGNYKEALALYRQILSRAQNTPVYAVAAYIGLTEIYSELGQIEEARKQVKEINRLNPNFTIKNWSITQPFKDPKHLEQRLAALRKAGLK